MKTILAAMLALTLMACASVPGSMDTPAQKVFAAKTAYNTALGVAVAYKGLPLCTVVPKPILCSDKGVVTTIQKADIVAFESLNTAEKIVRGTDQTDSALQMAVTWAQEAIGAFSRITATLRVK